jgi:hypothetical protein
VSNDPEELRPEIDVELGAAEDESDEDMEDEGVPDGFVVVGDDDDDVVDDMVGSVEDDDDDVDVGSTILDVVEVAAEDPDDFEEEIAPVVRVPDEEDDAPARRSGEFVCTRCFLVKRDSQLAVRSRKVCRDCT